MQTTPSIPKARRSGFTLMEIMLALLVVSVGILAALGLLGSSLDTSAKTHGDLDMVSFADLVFNHCHAAGFESVPASGTLRIPDYGQGEAELRIGSLARYTAMVPGFANTPKEAYAVSYRLEVLEDGRVKALSLLVWPGYDATATPRRFHTEIYNWSRK